MRLVRVAAAVLAGAVVLTGCSDGGTANETLPSTSTTAAETSEALEPLGPPDFPVPVEARNKTESGALAAGKYFALLTQYSYQSMNSTGLTGLSRACSYCEMLATAIAADSAAKYRYEGGAVSFRDEGQVVLKGTEAEVAFGLTQGPLEVIDQGGTAVEARRQPGFDVFTSFIMTWDDQLQCWLLNQVSNS
jgi:hypothetical protein